MNFLTITMIVGGLSFVGACSSKKAAAPASKKSIKNEECSSNATAKKKAGLKAGFKLAGSTYDDIKDIIDDECKACHTAGGPGGLDLSSYAKLKANAADVIRTITSEDDEEVMPSGEKMSASKIAKIKAWVDDGKKPAEEAEDEEDEEEEDDKKTTSKTTKAEEECEEEEDEDDLEKDDKENGKSESDDEEDDVEEEKTEVKKNDLDPELFKLYIEPPEMKVCHDDKKTFLRAGTSKDPVDPTPRCDAVAYPGKFTCDKAGTLAAFNNNAVVVAKVEEYLTKGYEFDQCGDAGGKPVVYFVCFKGTDEKCVAKDKITGTTLSILTGSIGRP